MTVRKKFKMTVSKKFANNTIVSFDFGTDLEEENISEEELFEKAFKSTMEDLKKKIKENKIIRAAWEAAKEGLKQEEEFKNLDWSEYE